MQQSVMFSAAFAAAALFTATPTEAQCVHQEQGSLVMIDVESVPPSAGWVEETIEDGFSGTSYYRWDGPDLFNNPGSGILTYRFNISDPGNYQMRINNHHDHPDTTLENDVFVRMDGGQWAKVFSWHFDRWDFISVFDYGHGNQPNCEYNLSAGEHTFEISGRSKNMRIDRIHFFKWEANDAFNPNQPQSPCDSGPTEPGASFCFGLACPCNNDDTTAGCRNSTGKGGKLTATGSTSVQADDLQLMVSNLPPNETGLIFMGSRDMQPLMVGDGRACTGGLYRFAPTTVSSSGDMSLQGLVSQAPTGMIPAGETRFFQAWTRDTLCGPPPAPCPSPCGANSNLSNAYRVTFTP